MDFLDFVLAMDGDKLIKNSDDWTLNIELNQI